MVRSQLYLVDAIDVRQTTSTCFRRLASIVATCVLERDTTGFPRSGTLCLENVLLTFFHECNGWDALNRSHDLSFLWRSSVARCATQRVDFPSKGPDSGFWYTFQKLSDSCSQPRIHCRQFAKSSRFYLTFYHRNRQKNRWSFMIILDSRIWLRRSTFFIWSMQVELLK